MNRSVCALGVAVSCVLAPQFAVAQPAALPPLPAHGGAAVAAPVSDANPAPDGARSTAPGSFSAPAGALSPLTPQQLYEHVRRGVVAILRNGSPSAVGTVLAGDGRILTALSAIAGLEAPDVRYADGTTVHTRVARTDKAIDLALLVPESRAWAEGLSASEADPHGLDVRAMLPARGAHLGPTMAALKGRTDAHARGGEPLLHMLDVEVQGVPLSGAPVLDSTGSVVAVLVRACKGVAGADAARGAAELTDSATSKVVSVCRPVVLGAPVSSIRSFLAPAAPSPGLAASAADATQGASTDSPGGDARSATPAPSRAAQAISAAPWLGIRGEQVVSGGVRGVRIAAVAPASPAYNAGLKPFGDVIVAVDGKPIATPEALAEQIGEHVAGDTVKLLVFGDGAFREVAVVLRPAAGAH